MFQAFMVRERGEELVQIKVQISAAKFAQIFEDYAVGCRDTFDLTKQSYNIKEALYKIQIAKLFHLSVNKHDAVKHTVPLVADSALVLLDAGVVVHVVPVGGVMIPGLDLDLEFLPFGDSVHSEVGNAD